MAEVKQHNFNGKILVFGATGKVGTPLVQALLAKGAHVRALVRNEVKAKQTLGEAPNLELVKGDITDSQSVAHALKGIQRVFLLSNGDPDTELAVAKVAKENHVQLLVKLSVLGASHDGGYLSILRQHIEAEDRIHALGIPYVFLRPTFFFQNFFTDAHGIKNQGAISRPKSNYPFTVIDTRDVADAAAHILSAADTSRFAGRVFELSADDDVYTMEQVAELFTRVLGKPVKFVPVDDAVFYSSLQGVGVPEPIAYMLVKLYQQSRRGVYSTAQGDFKIITGKQTRRLEAFIAENKAAFV